MRLDSDITLPEPLRGPAKLLALAVLLLVVLLAWYRPQKVEARATRLAGLENRTAALETQLARARASRAEFGGRAEAFRALAAGGLFASQARLEAAELIDRLRVRIGVARVSYQFGQRSRRALADSTGGLDLYHSRVDLQIDAATDRRARAFLAALADGLPGRLGVRRLDIVRRAGLGGESWLEALSRGEPAAAAAGPRAARLVRVDAVLDWYALAPDALPAGIVAGAREAVEAEAPAPSDPPAPAAAPERMGRSLMFPADLLARIKAAAAADPGGANRRK